MHIEVSENSFTISDGQCHFAIHRVNGDWVIGFDSDHESVATFHQVHVLRDWLSGHVEGILSARSMLSPCDESGSLDERSDFT